MSFGFAIGDFIATGELCWRLYREVYEVAKGAPAEVQALHRELSDMSNVIKALVEDVKQPGSAIAEAGADRVSLANSVMDRTKEILQGLEELLKKYDILKLPRNGTQKRMFVKHMWSSIKYSSSVGKINELRSRLVYQNGLITLLLLAGNNSSLERIRSQHDELLKRVEEIKAYIQTPPTVLNPPLITASLDTDSQFQLTKAFMKSAEAQGRSWTSIGIDDWIQVGKWWLMKAQIRLYSSKEGTPEIFQAYADLLKASWILSDVIAAHPQMSFITNGVQQLEIQRLGNVIVAEHKKMNHHLTVKPQIEWAMESDLNIWSPISMTMLVPRLSEAGLEDSSSWQTDSGEIIYQRFGMYRLPSTGSQTECIILIEARTDVKSLNVTAQTSQGREVLRYNILDQKVLPPKMRPEEDGLHPVSFDVLNNAVTFYFADRKAARLFWLLLKLIPAFRAAFPDSPFDIKSLRAGSLLQYAYYFVFEFGHEELDPEEDLDYLIGNQRQPQLEENVSDVWSLAIHASNVHQYHLKLLAALKFSQSRRSLLSLVFWVSPTAECALQALDYLVPPSTALREQYVNELIRMALYRRQHTFSRSILRHFGYPPTFIDTVPGEATDILADMVLQHLGALKERIGADAIFSLALSQEHVGLLDEVLILNDGVFPWNLRDLIRKVVRTKDAMFCNTLLQLKAHIRDPFQMTEVFNEAVALRFHEGMRLILANCHDRKRLDGTISALSSFDYELFHLLKVYGCLEPNLDPLLECEVVAENVIDVSTHALNSQRFVYDHTILQWYMNVESDPDAGQLLGPCHFPLYMAVFLASDIRIISDLISAGGLLMCREFFNKPRVYPKILQHVSTCMAVEKAREIFKGTLEYMRRLFLLKQLTRRALGSKKIPIMGEIRGSLKSWSAIAKLLNFTENPTRSAKWIWEPRTISLVMGDTVSAQTANSTPVDMPKSLQTQELWTMWREQVQNTLTRGLEDQVLNFDKEEEPPRSQSVNQPSHAIENRFLIRGYVYQIDDNWNVVQSSAFIERDDYGLIYDCWRLSHSAHSTA